MSRSNPTAPPASEVVTAGHAAYLAVDDAAPPHGTAYGRPTFGVATRSLRLARRHRTLDLDVVLEVAEAPAPSSALERVVTGARLVLGIDPHPPADVTAAAAADRGSDAFAVYARDGDVRLAFGDRELACAPLAATGSTRLDVQLDAAAARALVGALAGRRTDLAVAATLVYRQRDSDRPGELQWRTDLAVLFADLPDGALDANVRLEIVGPAGRVGVGRSRARARTRGDRAAVPLVGGSLTLAKPVSVATALVGAEPVATPSAAFAAAALRPSVAHLLLDDITVVGTEGRPVPGPLVADAAADSWPDRIDPNRRWFAPTFVLLTPDPSAPESSPFVFTVERAGTTSAGETHLRAELRCSIEATRPAGVPEDATAVPLLDLNARLDVPFVDEATGETRHHQLVASVMAENGHHRLQITAAGSWARLLYGAVSTPGFQAQPARLEVTYTFSGYVETGGPRPFVLAGGGKLLHTPLAADLAASRQLAGSPHLRVDTHEYDAGDGTRVKLQTERADVARRPRPAALSVLAANKPSALAVAHPVVTVKPEVLDTIRPADESPALARRTVAKRRAVDLLVSCIDFGQLYRQRDGDGSVAIGCQEALRLGEIAFKRFTPVPSLTNAARQVLASTAQPDRFLVVPAAYHLARFGPEEGDRAYRPRLLVYSVLDASNPANNRVVVDALLEPAIPAWDLHRLLVDLSSRSSQPTTEWPTMLDGADVDTTWTSLTGLDVDIQATVLARGIHVSISSGLVGWHLLRSMLEGGGIPGVLEVELDDGTPFRSDLILDLRHVVGPWETGPVEATLRGGDVHLHNRIERPVDVTDVDIYGGDAPTRLPAEQTLAPDTTVVLPVPAGTTRVLPIVRVPATGAVSIEEIRSFVEEIDTRVVFVDLVNLESRGLERLEVEARIKDVEGTQQVQLTRDQDVAEATFILPLTRILDDHVVEYRVTTVAAGGVRGTGPWHDQHLGTAANVISITASHLVDDLEEP